MKRFFLLCVVAALIFRSLDASAQPTGAAVRPVRQAASPLQALVAAITVNSEPKGEGILYLEGQDDFLIKLSELEALAKVPATIEAVEIEGEHYIALKRLPGAEIVFDEKTLTLAIVLPPEAFENRVYSLATSRASAEPLPDQFSALLNYRMSHTGDDQGSAGNWVLGAEEGLHLGNWLFANQNQFLYDARRFQSLRYGTQLIRDYREHMQRLTLGDAFTAPRELGASVPVAGVSFSKAYQLSPYFVRVPSVNFAGTTSLPSEVDFYVGDTRVLRQQVSPGPFEIADFNYYGGQRDVRVVLRDNLGREQTIAYPFYFTDQGLARGLHDYSYQIGVLRRDFGLETSRYGSPAFSTFHAYGFTDSITLGFRTEGTADYGNLGLNAVLRSDYLGVLSLNGASSLDGGGRRGAAYAAAYSFQSGGFSGVLAGRRFSDAYTALTAGVPVLPPKRELNGSLGYSIAGLGSLNIGYSRRDSYINAGSSQASLGYSRSFLRKLNVFATYRHRIGQSAGDEVFIGLQYQPGANHTVGASVQANDAGRQHGQIQVANALPQGQGYGYRLGLERENDPVGAATFVSPELQLNTRYAALSGIARSQFGSAASATTYSVAMAGSLATVGGHVGFNRPISDSFGVAEITPPLADVRVYQNSQEVGRTDSNGQLFLPEIISFIDNHISINDKDIPIEYGMDRTSRLFSASFRSGSVLKFLVRRTQSFAGSLKYSMAGTPLPLEYHSVLLTVGADKIDFLTGGNGDFYLENIPAGTHQALVRIGAVECTFTVVLPESPEIFIALGEVMTCDVAP
ncbi:MAG: fimbria/pilus outer membrane usher protein [Pseudomonadota bacterium]